MKSMWIWFTCLVFQLFKCNSGVPFAVRNKQASKGFSWIELEKRNTWINVVIGPRDSWPDIHQILRHIKAFKGDVVLNIEGDDQYWDRLKLDDARYEWMWNLLHRLELPSNIRFYHLWESLNYIFGPQVNLINQGKIINRTRISRGVTDKAGGVSFPLDIEDIPKYFKLKILWFVVLHRKIEAMLEKAENIKGKKVFIYSLNTPAKYHNLIKYIARKAFGPNLELVIF